MKKTLLLLTTVLFLLASCKQQPLSFLRSMDIGVDSLMMDTVPQPNRWSGYKLTVEQVDKLFGDYSLLISKEYSRITGIKAVKENYLISFTSYSIYEYLVLFSPSGELLDGVNCGLWEADSNTKNVQEDSVEYVVVRALGEIGECHGHCIFTSDTTFIIESVEKLNGLALHRRHHYQIHQNRIHLLNIEREEKPAKDTPWISWDGWITEEGEHQWNEVCRKPLCDTTAISDWNKTLCSQSEYARKSGSGARYLYYVNPRAMLKWVYDHRNDTANHILTGLQAQYSKNEYLRNHICEQIKKQPQQEVREYLEEILGTTNP